MSRPDHIVRRFQGRLGESWWWRRYADLVDRRQEDGSYKKFDYQAHKFVMTQRNMAKYFGKYAVGNTKKERARAMLVASQAMPVEVRQPYRVTPLATDPPGMVERDQGMTRQTQRRLYREACTVAGAPWKKPRTVKTPRRLRGMTPVQRALWEEAQWQAFKAQFVTIAESAEVETPKKLEE